MAKRARMTVFSRFFLTMLVVAPLAFMGASYYNGKDGLQALKNLFNMGQPVTETPANRPDAPTKEMDAIMEKELRKAKDDLNYQEERIRELRKENEDLKIKVSKLEAALKEK